MTNKTNSPYMSLTGCPFLYYEFKRLLPLLMAEDSSELIAKEISENSILQINSEISRKRFVSEFKRRFNSVPITFWQQWQTWSEQGQRAGLLYAILKTYKLAFDLHMNVTLKKWNSVDPCVTKPEVMMEITEIAAQDSYVDGWSDKTKSKSAVHYLVFLRQAGLMNDKDNNLKSIHLDPSEYEYYIRNGEEWFLSACLLKQYEINDIKKQIL